jgi:hypothetical protein
VHCHVTGPQMHGYDIPIAVLYATNYSLI